MALNTIINNSFPSGVTITGAAATFNTSGSGTTTIGSSSGAALVMASNANSTWTLSGQTFSILTGTGTINLQTNSSAGAFTLGTSSAQANIQCTGMSIVTGSNSSSAGTLTKLGTGNFVVSASGTGLVIMSCTAAGTINIAGATVPTSVQIGVRGSAVNGTIGTSTTTSTTTIQTGSGTINLGTSIAKSITIGNSAASFIVVLQCGTGGLNFPTSVISGTTATIVPGYAYIANNGSVVTLTLPATAALGSYVRVAGLGAGGWTIAQNASQQINSTATSTTSGTGGSLSSGGRYDCVELVCTVANTNWSIANSTGTLTFV